MKMLEEIRYVHCDEVDTNVDKRLRMLVVYACFFVVVVVVFLHLWSFCLSCKEKDSKSSILAFAQNQVQQTMTCSQLHKRAERIGCMLMEKGKLNSGDHVALVFHPGETCLHQV